jgi:hypothetical protein
LTVESDGIGINERINATAPTLGSKVAREGEHPAAVTSTLQIVADRDATKDGNVVADVDSNGADGSRAIPEQEWKVPRRVLVRVIGIVRRASATEVEENASANGVVFRPIRSGDWSSQFYLPGHDAGLSA